MNPDEKKFLDSLIKEMEGYKNTLSEILNAHDIFCLSDAQFVAKQALQKYHFYEGETADGIDGDVSKYPSFFKNHGRHPVPGVDYDPEEGFCQDDYEYFTGTGQYSDTGARPSDNTPTYDDRYDPKESYLPDY